MKKRFILKKNVTTLLE